LREIEKELEKIREQLEGIEEDCREVSDETRQKIIRDKLNPIAGEIVK